MRVVAAAAASIVLFVSAAAGAPASGELQVTLVKPKSGSIVYGKQFKIVVNVVGGQGETIHVSLLANGPGSPSNATGPDGNFTLPERFNQAGSFTFTVNAEAGTLSGHLTFKLTIEPPVTAIQALDGSLVAPGCRICAFRDPRGDNFGALPDIVSASSKYSHGWLVHRIVTYGSIRSSPGPTCLIAYWRLNPNQIHDYSFNACSALGKLVGNCRAGAHWGTTCGSAHLSFPNAHTMMLRFRPGQIGNPRSYYWDVWVLYPGDQLKDAAPSYGGRLQERGSKAPYCMVRQVIRPELARNYYFGSSKCSQRRVTKAVP